MTIIGGILTAALVGIVMRHIPKDFSAPAADWQEVRAERKVLVDLPRDDAPHDNMAMEWWYYNGHLTNAAGQIYSFHFVSFVVDGVVKQLVFHLAFTNHQTGKHYTYQQRRSLAGGKAGPEGFDLTIGDWRMMGSGGRDTLVAKTPQFEFKLNLSPGTEPRFHGGTGLLDFKAAGTSYYYSRPKMPIQGTLNIGGKPEAVTGQAWFDHQWGNFRTDLLQWNWFALQFDDGSDLMLYQLRDPSGQVVLASGTLGREGHAELIQDKDFLAEALDVWKSPETQIDYPLRWHVKLPGKGIDLNVNPVIDGAEIDARTSSYKVYWEGPIRFSGTQKGIGFLEVSKLLPSSQSNLSSR